MSLNFIHLDHAVQELSEWVRQNTTPFQPSPRFNLQRGLIMVVDGRRKGLENLVLLNYHPTASFRRAEEWKDIERVARGLVFEKGTGRLVARPFTKFHNYGEFKVDADIKASDVRSIDYKEDGSLGICFFYNDEWWVTTHGSLNSEQGERGTEILRRKKLSVLRQDVTHMAEIVYPQNRIVTNYGDVEDLILLDCLPLSVTVNFNISPKYFKKIRQEVFTFESPYSKNVDFDLEDEHLIQNILDFCETQPDYNFEGFVVTLNDGKKVKFKTKEYLSVHRCRFAVSLAKVKELMLESPETLVQWKETLPNEFFDEVDGMIKVLTDYTQENFDCLNKAMREILASHNITQLDDIKAVSRLVYQDIAKLPKHLQASGWSYIKGVDDVRLYNQILDTFDVKAVKDQTEDSIEL